MSSSGRHRHRRHHEEDLPLDKSTGHVYKSEHVGRGGPSFTTMVISLIEGKKLAAMDIGGKSDPYVILKYGSVTQKSKVINSTLDPKWEEHYEIEYDPKAEPKISFEVYDKDLTFDDFIGKCTWDLEKMEDKREQKRWLELTDKEGKKTEGKKLGEIKIAVTLHGGDHHHNHSSNGGERAHHRHHHAEAEVTSAPREGRSAPTEPAPRHRSHHKKAAPAASESYEDEVSPAPAKKRSSRSRSTAAAAPSRRRLPQRSRDWVKYLGPDSSDPEDIGQGHRKRFDREVDRLERSIVSQLVMSTGSSRREGDYSRARDDYYASPRSRDAELSRQYGRAPRDEYFGGYESRYGGSSRREDPYAHEHSRHEGYYDGRESRRGRDYDYPREEYRYREYDDHYRRERGHSSRHY